MTLLWILGASHFYAPNRAQAAISPLVQSQIQKYKLSGDDLGLFISNIEESIPPHISWNAKQPFVPASTTKILVASAALHYWSPHHRFETHLYAKDEVVEGVLKGPLFLKGFGDPTFISEQLWVLVNEFKRAGIERVEGPLVVDSSWFDSAHYHGRSVQRVDRSYDAPVSALSLNWNSVGIFVRPGKKAGSPARVFLSPHNEMVQLRNTAVTRGKSARLRVRRQTKAGGPDTIVVSGRIPLHHKEKVFWRNITQPALWAGHSLKQFLARRGVSVVGAVQAGETPKLAKKVASSEGATLRELVAKMMKFSNNFIAEMLTKNLSLMEASFSPHNAAVPGNLSGGISSIFKYLEKMGVRRTSFQIPSVSGLSSENRITPESLAQLLRKLARNTRYGPEFLSSLPIAGQDGTLKTRMKAIAGFVRAKTGFLSGAITLAGYFTTKKNKTFVFVFFYNGKKSRSHVQSFYDDTLVQLVRL